MPSRKGEKYEKRILFIFLLVPPARCAVPVSAAALGSAWRKAKQSGEKVKVTWNTQQEPRDIRYTRKLAQKIPQDQDHWKEELYGEGLHQEYSIISASGLCGFFRKKKYGKILLPVKITIKTAQQQSACDHRIPEIHTYKKNT